MIEKIYNNQLDALLFSVNQYSEDVAGRLQFKLNTVSEENNLLLTDPKLTSFAKENSYIKKIVLVDSSLKSSDQTINSILQYNKEKLTKLYSFLKEKYNRIEPIEYKGSTFLFFVLDKSAANTLCGVEIDSDKFIRDILTPKILSIAKDEFSIYVFSNEKINTFKVI
jgi:two-component system phosphate regulon sensor histidine kinase PhoR